MLLVYVLFGVIFALLPRAIYRVVGVTTNLQWGYARVLFSSVVFAVALSACDQLFGAVGALPLGVAGLVGMAIAATFRARRFRGFERLAEALLVPEQAEAAFLGIENELRALWSGKQRPRVAGVLSLFFVDRGIRAGHARRALAWLEMIPAAKLGVDLHEVYMQYRASAHVRLGERAEARRALQAVPRPARTPGFEEGLQALEGLVDALDGAPTAEARATAALAQKLAPTVRTVWRATWAHTLAARHADDELASLFREIRQADGREAIQRIVDHKGPASARAASFLAAEGPYR